MLSRVNINLNPDERVIFQGHPSWRAILGFYLKGVLVAVILFIWIPYKRSILGRAAFAIGSSEQAAYMSGVPIARAKILAYALSGLLSSIAWKAG